MVNYILETTSTRVGGDYRREILSPKQREFSSDLPLNQVVINAYNEAMGLGFLQRSGDIWNARLLDSRGGLVRHLIANGGDCIVPNTGEPVTPEVLEQRLRG